MEKVPSIRPVRERVPKGSWSVGTKRGVSTPRSTDEDGRVIPVRNVESGVTKEQKRQSLDWLRVTKL